MTSARLLLVQRSAAFALPAWFLLSGMLCGPTGPFLRAEIAEDPLRECQQFTCPIAKGTSMSIQTGYYDTDVDVTASPSQVTYMPNGIVETVSIDEGVLTVQGIAEGTTLLSAIINGETITQRISVAKIAKTEVQIFDAPVPQALASEGLAIVVNAELSLFARHLGADGQPLVAEEVANWSLESPSDSRLEERELWTLVAGAAEESLQISAGDGEPLLLDVVPVSAVAEVRLYPNSELATGLGAATITEGETILLSEDQYGRGLLLAPLTADGAMIVGASAEVIEVSGNVATVDAFQAGDKFLFIRPVAVGVGVVRLRVGERIVSYPIRVAP